MKHCVRFMCRCPTAKISCQNLVAYVLGFIVFNVSIIHKCPNLTSEFSDNSRYGENLQLELTMCAHIACFVMRVRPEYTNPMSRL
jgi:hypothetical protein